MAPKSLQSLGLRASRVLVAPQLGGLQLQLDRLSVEVGRLNAARAREARDLNAAEFRVFSQFGEDGILQWLLHRVEMPARTFVEFGVEDYRESNTRFLVEEGDWSGLAIDGGTGHRSFAEASQLAWRHTVDMVTAFLTAENLDNTIRSAGYEGEVGLVSIDVDGIDYWLLKALSVVQPRILVVEYNSLFGRSAAVTVPYDPHFDRTVAHWSTLYFGASITALERLADEKGYALVGSNIAATNAFFVRRDLLGTIPVAKASDCWRASTVRQARDRTGQLLYISDVRRQFEMIADMPVLDLDSNTEMPLKRAVR